MPTKTRHSPRVPIRPAPGESEAPSLQPPVTVGILHNPRSGGNRGRTDLRVQRAAARYGAPLAIARNPGEIEEALTRLIEQRATVLALSGGDGTIQAALTTLQKEAEAADTLPPIALLRSGTSAMTARDMGLPGRPERALNRLLAWAGGSGGDARIHQRALLAVRPHPGAEPIYGFFLGAAAIAQGVAHFHRQRPPGRRGGGLGPALTLLRGLAEAGQEKARIARPVPIGVGNGAPAGPSRDYLVFLVTSLERLMLGMTPYWGSEEGPIRYTGIEAGASGLLRHALRIARGQPGKALCPERGYHSHNAGRLELALDSLLYLDGEQVTPDPEQGPVTVAAAGAVHCLVL